MPESQWRPRMQCCLVICGASPPSVLPMPVELNSVSDSSRRHSPTKRIGSINAGWGGVTWVCVGRSKAVGLMKRRMGQDDTWTHFPPLGGLPWCRGVCVCVCVCFVFFQSSRTRSCEWGWGQIPEYCYDASLAPSRHREDRQIEKTDTCVC